ncbi:MAG: hypothetical protein AB7F59_01030 [Bdellovibrionales bacterium]
MSYNKKMHLGRSFLVILLVVFCTTTTCLTARSQELEEVDGETYTDSPDVDYSERRGTVGSLVTFGYSWYTPSDYRPDFVTNQTFTEYYESAETPLMEFTYSLKLNVSFFSLSADIGAGYYSNQGRDQSTLTLTPVRLGSTLSLDGVFSEPYFVPYVSVGAYSMFYKESVASQSVSGRTTPAMYYAFGGRLQLDMLDGGADFDSYVEHGIENTFLFLEARSFGASKDAVPDVSSPADAPLQLGGGLSIEF